VIAQDGKCITPRRGYNDGGVLEKDGHSGCKCAKNEEF
jgi:hypothetical protein